jgi:hypothetical protein
MMTDSSPPRPPESPAVSTLPFRPPPWLPWIVAVALAVGCAWLGQLYLVTRAQNALLGDQQTLADFERRTVQNQLEAERIIARHELAGLRGESANALEIALLSPPDDPASRAWGAVAWNPAAQQGVLQIAHLRPPPAGQRYRLWLADTRDTPAFDGSVIVFGTADGAARMSFHSSRPLSATPRFVVRLENENAPPAAHAPIVLQTP